METLRYLPMIRSAGAELAFNQKKEEMENTIKTFVSETHPHLSKAANAGKHIDDLTPDLQEALTLAAFQLRTLSRKEFLEVNDLLADQVFEDAVTPEMEESLYKTSEFVDTFTSSTKEVVAKTIGLLLEAPAEDDSNDEDTGSSGWYVQRAPKKPSGGSNTGSDPRYSAIVSTYRATRGFGRRYI